MLQQALRAKAGGRATTTPAEHSPASSAVPDSSRRRLSTLQTLLLAAILGALVGIVAGVVIWLL